MNTSKIIALTISAIIAVAIMLFIIQLLLRKLKPKSEQEDKLNTSYGIWFSSLFIGASIVIGEAISLLSIALDNIYKNTSQNLLIEIVKTTSLFIGISVLWFLLWYFMSNLLSVTIVGKRKSQNEVEVNNISYFLIKGILVIGFIFCLSSVFEIILRNLIPSIQIPFYH
jgi:hypothetical protein